MVLAEMRADGHEQVTVVRDEATGLEAVVAVHDTTLGPALGGTRILEYPTEEAALADALRLSRAMTYKAAAADLDLGGGKAVILGDPDEVKSEAALRAYGRAIDRLGGAYITAEDMNTAVADLDVVSEVTDHVVGTTAGLGDPSPVTAYGVEQGIRAAVAHRFGEDTLEHRTVLVQGVGKVGADLAERLVDAGADVKIADPREGACQAVVDAAAGDVTVVDVEDALTEPCDVLAPCAASHLGLGSAEALEAAIPNLECDVVAGSSNNALGDHDEALALAERLENAAVLYAPDYVINAGGLVLTDHERRGSTREAAIEEAAAIGDRLAEMFEEAEAEGITPLAAANRYAERRLAGD
ncbi:Glu/Leu/Phe/Val dehydrogenase dimerization domain-containing protein [Halobacteriales archaeon Cl-PHB]